MLFARAMWSRGMIGLRPERQTTSLDPTRALLPRDRRGADVRVEARHAAASSATGSATKWPSSDLDQPLRSRAVVDRGRRPAASVSRHLRVELRHRGEQQPACTGGAGSRTRFSVGAHLDDRAAAHDHRAVADVVAEREVVGDEEDPEPALLEVAEQVQDVDPGRGVEHADDLVGDEQADVEQQRPRDQHPLELAAGELVRVLAEHVARVRGSRPRATRASFACHSARLVPAKYASRIIAKTRSALKIGLYELNGSWKTPCTSRVVAPSSARPSSVEMSAPSKVIAPRVVRERAAGSSSRSSTCRCRSRRSARRPRPAGRRRRRRGRRAARRVPNAPTL